MARDLMGDIICGSLLPPTVRTAGEDGTAVDLVAYKSPRELVCYLSVGDNVSGTNPTLDVKIQDSDDNSNFSDISGAAFAQATAATTESLGIKNPRRYVRAVSATGGTSPSFPCSVMFVGGGIQQKPA